MRGFHTPTGITVRAVVELIAFELDRTPLQIVQPGKSAFMREAKFACFWVANEVTGLGLTAVARALGRHHATAIDWQRQAEFLREWDPDFLRLTDLAVATLLAAHEPALEMAA